MRVLLVEDDADVLNLTSVVLRRAGHEVLTAVDGVTGTDMALHEDPDLVLLDLMIPERNGFEGLRHLSDAGFTDRTPVVVVSAFTALADRQAAMEAGAVAFLSKPYSRSELLHLLAGLEGLEPGEIAARRVESLEAAPSHPNGRSTHGRPDTDAPPARSVPEGDEPLAGILDLSVDAIVSVDAEQCIIGFNRGAERMFGYRADELIGQSLDRLIPPDLAAGHRDHVRKFGRGQETARHMGERREIHGLRKDGSLFPAEASILKNVVDGQLTFTAVLRDVSERQELIQELRSRARQQAAIASLGQVALRKGADGDSFLQEVATTIADTLEVDLVEVCHLRHDSGELEIRAAVGFEGDVVGSSIETGSGSHAGYVLTAGQPVLVADLERETRFTPSRILTDHGAISGLGVTVPGQQEPFGVLGAYSLAPRSFADDDVYFLQAVANVIAALVERTRVEDRLRRFLDAAPDATLVIDDAGLVVSANPQAVELLGFPVDELVGTAVDELVPERFRQTHAAHREAYADEPRLRPMGAGRELSVLRADGSEVAVEIMLNPVETDEGMLVVAALRDVTERRQVEATREAFLRAVSHDLRTPLTSLLGYTELLADDPSLEDEAREFVSRMRTNAEKLERLLSDLLDLDRLTRGVLRPNRRPTDIAELVHDVVDAVGEDEYPVEIVVDPDAQVASIDPAQVERVLENLLVNVHRHTPAGTPCRVRVDRDPSGILLTVDDEGQGISDELKETVFDAFHRGDGGHHAPGTGVGLSLVRRFAQLHEGRAWAEDAPGGGARFCVLLGHG